MKRIKWGNVIKAIGFVFCIGMILYDTYMLTIGSWINGEMVGFTWLGLITYILFFAIAGSIYDDFEMELKKVPYGRNIRHQHK